MNNLPQLWPGWNTVRVLGHGSFGAVYEIERDLFGKEKAALKTISIPKDPSEISQYRSEGYDDASITQSFHAHMQSLVEEYKLVRQLDDCANVVHCFDAKAVQHEDGFGWDFYILMELLTPLTNALDAKPPEEQVLALAKDLCNALVYCRKFNIIHRDIKPANVFRSPKGVYKLGDFGIAKTAEATMMGTTAGTYDYMAPEVYYHQPYGHAVDVYSLGLVLYWLLNERRGPFLPLPPAAPTAAKRSEAQLRRFQGEALPAPAHGSAELQRIVLKACAFDPQMRYATADEMLRDLNAIGQEISAPQPKPAPIPAPVPQPEPPVESETVVLPDNTVVLPPQPEPALKPAPEPLPEPAPQPEPQPVPEPASAPVPSPTPAPKKKNKLPLLVAAIVALIAVCILAVFASAGSSRAPAMTPHAFEQVDAYTYSCSVHGETAHVFNEALSGDLNGLWGNSAYGRDDVNCILFLSYLSGAPEDAWDVSAAGDRSILAWVEDEHLHVGADGLILAPKNAGEMFRSFSSVVHIYFDDVFYTPITWSMQDMFEGCYALISLDLSCFDTSNVENMWGMFADCSKLLSLDISSFTIRADTLVNSMFYNCPVDIDFRALHLEANEHHKNFMEEGRLVDGEPWMRLFKGEGAMTFEEFSAAQISTAVTIEASVKEASLWENGRASFFLGDGDGGYYVSNMACSESDYALISAQRTRLRISGTKGALTGGEVFITNASFVVLEEWGAGVTYYWFPPSGDMKPKMNRGVHTGSLTVEQIQTLSSGDIWLDVDYYGEAYTLLVRADLVSSCPGTEVYENAKKLQPGDIIAVSGMLFWNNGPRIYITNISSLVLDPVHYPSLNILFAPIADCDRMVRYSVNLPDLLKSELQKLGIVVDCVSLEIAGSNDSAGKSFADGSFDVGWMNLSLYTTYGGGPVILSADNTDVIAVSSSSVFGMYSLEARTLQQALLNVMSTKDGKAFARVLGESSYTLVYPWG